MPVGRRPVLRAALATGVAGLLAACTRSRRADGPAADRTDARDVIGFPYGDHPQQRADLWLPRGEATGPVVALIHGGYWESGYDRSLQDAVAADLVAAGRPVWNVDYRPAPDAGWPGTFTDVAAALDRLPAAGSDHDLDVDGVVVIGHSAGGTLALWGAARGGLPAGAPGAGPALRPVAAISQAGVNDLVAGSAANLGGGAVNALMGGSPDTVADDRYDTASPAALTPLGVRQLVVTGDADVLVPPSQSTTYAAAAQAAGDDVTLVVVPGEDHFAHLDPTTACWAQVRVFLGVDQPS